MYLGVCIHVNTVQILLFILNEMESPKAFQWRDKISLTFLEG